jgi:hypothetical protein
MSQESYAKAGRAKGAIFFSIFGAAWLIVWCLLTYGFKPGIIALISVITITIFYASLRKFLRNRTAQSAEGNSPTNKRAGRLFKIVNAVQWILISAVAIALSGLGHQEWIIPSIILIIGFHFFPLAAIFKYPLHYVTGATLVLLAIIYPLASTTGAAGSISCLGAGIILWSSAIGALMSRPSSQSNSTKNDELT